MVGSEIIDYVSNMLDQGYTREQIRGALLDSGWLEQDINDAIKHFTPKQIPTAPAPHREHPQQKPAEQHPSQGQSTQEQKPLGTLSRVKMIVFHPNQFFDRVKDEQGYGAPLKFHAFLCLTWILAVLLYIFVPGSLLGVYMGITVYSLMITIASILTSIISMFIAAAFLHVIAVILGAKKGYFNTYRALVYSSVAMIFFWFYYILVLINFWVSLILFGVFILWGIYLQVKSLSKFHEISGMRAFGIIMVPVAISALLALLAFGFLLLFMGNFNPTTYNGRIPTGFTTLGAPQDWDLDGAGDFDIVLRNNLAKQIEIYKIETTMGSVTDSYEPSPPITIGPSGTQTVFSSQSGLNLGPQSGSFSVNVKITYNSGGFDMTETGSVTGTVA